MKYRVFLQALTVVLIFCFAPPAWAAEPAGELGQKLFCWKVTGPKGVVYLLGTLHVGSADFYPLAEKIRPELTTVRRIINSSWIAIH